MAFIPNDTRFNLQWHLLNNDPTEFDLNVVDVWDDYDGSGVEVVAIDRGFDYFHPDYDNYRTDLDWDFEDADDSVALPDTTENDHHGTPVLGLIGAAQDGQGTVGIAFGADIIGYKTDWSRDEIAAGIDRANSMGHDVVNMSYWNGSNMFSPSEQSVGLVGAIAEAAEDGRGGLGLNMVKSAGNGRGLPDANDRAESTIESVNNMRETVVVAGVRDDGGVHGSSSPGANVLVSAFYGGVQTTDRSGTAGYNSNTSANGGDFTNFNGTSAAAPQVAGVIALMLDANPNLGWRDVQDILAKSARHVGSSVGANATGNEEATQSNGATWFWNDDQTWNGGGMHFSNDYGFGLVDAKTAVRLAETWTTQKTSANEATPARVDGLDNQVTIANGSTSGGSNFFSLTFDEGIELENITLGINFVSVADLADLEVYLTSPGGTRVRLIADTGDSENWSGYWRFGSTAFRGEDSAGTWRVQVRDDDNAVTSPIVINDIDLWTYGAPDSNDDLFVFTNEYSQYANVAGHTTNIVGGAGHDVINASAVDTGVTVNLQNGQGIIDGVLVTMSGIEEVFGGDHQDILFDGAGANQIHGGRGNDIIRDTTSGGNDTYYGDQGDDSFQVYSAIAGDAFHGGSGRDRISWTQSGESSATFDLQAGEARDADGHVEQMTSFADIVGTARGDIIIESNAANDIDGYRGNDTVIVRTSIGSDAFHGGAGRDTIDWSAVNETGATFDLAAGTATDSAGNVEVMDGFENIIGTDQADIITENGATNVIDARGGNDLVFVTSSIGNDSFTGGFGADTIDWSGSSQANGVYDISGGTATAGSNTEVMFGFENFIGTGQSDRIIEGSGTNVINAGGGNDTVEVNTAIGLDSFTGGFGTDTIDWSGSSQANGVYDISGGTATTGRNTETMFGFENFIGTNQSDRIIEGVGTNVIDAGGGDDIVEVNTAIGLDSITGGFGTDTIDWSGSSQANGVYDISGGTATADGNTEVMFGFENFIGTNQSDRIIEGVGTNVINAGSGNDTVEVNTVIGVDSFTGGFGTDTIDWSGSAQVNGVYDISGGTATAGSNTETMFGFENFIGTNQSDRIIEGAGTNVIDAGDGDDAVEVHTGIGADSYDGGAGTDLIDWSGISQSGITFDLQSEAAVTAGGASEVMANFEDLIGTGQDDTILGTSGSNVLTGLAGEDNIRGRAGDDTISGGEDRDVLYGNAGADLISGDEGNDTLRGGSGDDRLMDGSGRDNLFGNAGSDIFDFGIDESIDRARDFLLGTDFIALSGFSFGELDISDMNSGHVRIDYGTDRLIVHDTAGTLNATDFAASDFLFA